jgi:hypothetical protein
MNLDQLHDIIERDGANMLALTINKNSPELAKGKFPTRKLSGVKQINVTAGLLHGGPGADGAAYVDPGTGAIVSLFADRKLFYSQVKIPVGAASAADSPAKGVHLVNQRYDEQMGTLVMSLGMALFDSTIGVVSTGATIAANAVTLSFADATRFREGMKLMWNDNGTPETTNLFTVTDVTLGANGVSGTVDFSTNATGTIVASDDSFILADSTSSRSLTSLVSLAGSSNVYTQSAAIAGYKGSTVAHNAGYSAEAVLKLLTRMRQRGANPRMLIAGPAVEAEHRALYGSSTYLRKEMGNSKSDPYGNGEIEINGVRCIITPNCPADKIFAIDPDTTYLGKFKDWGSLNNGGKKAEYSQVGYNYLIGQHGQFELISDNRRGVGVLTGITFS